MDDNTLAWIVFGIYVSIFIGVTIVLGKCCNPEETKRERLIKQNKKPRNYYTV